MLGTWTWYRLLGSESSAALMCWPAAGLYDICASMPMGVFHLACCRKALAVTFFWLYRFASLRMDMPPMFSFGETSTCFIFGTLIR